MNFARLSGFGRSDRARQSRGPQLVLMALFLSAYGSFAQAQAVLKSYQPDSGEAPWSVLATAPYVTDPGFNSGLYYADAFAGNPFEVRLGRRIVHLANGDVIAAGVVPATTGANRAPINLGLVRYNSAGQRVAWSNPGLYGFFADSYVIFPNSGVAGNSSNVKDVLDLKVVGNRVFVMTDHRFNGGDDIDSIIHVFGTDGSYIRSTKVFGTVQPEYSGGMVVYSSLTLPETVTVLVTGTTFNGVWRPTFRRGTLNGDSSIALDAVVFPNPGNSCPSNRGCILRTIAVGGSFVFGPPTRFYLGGTRQFSSNDWDFLVMAVNSDGSPLTAFSGDGVINVPFDDGGDSYDDVRSISVQPGTGFLNTRDRIYASGFVDRTCKDGFGVVKLTEAGDLDTTFGSSGKLVVGGANPGPGGLCPILGSSSAAYANDMTLASGKLAVAGFTARRPMILCIVGEPCPEDIVDGMVAVIDTEQGDVESFRTYPYSDLVNGARSRHSGFFGIVASGNGTFTATGDVRYFQIAAGQPSGGQQFGTLRVRSDRIFAGNFGIGGDP
ncbi:MAG: hypothetical protein ABI650_08915 [Dokdonella sp.]